MSGTVDLEITPPLAVVTLARPEKMNALTFAMLARLGEIAEQVERDASVRVVLLTGAGGRAFCGGADIAEWAALDPQGFARDWLRAGNRLFDRWAALRPPVIAVINGLALGGGLELAATADLRVAEAQARFGLPEARLGIVPGWSGTQRLVRRCGGQAVRRLALTGEPVDAAEALRLGLVDVVCPTGEGLATARALAAGIAERAPLAVQTVKQLVNAAESEGVAATLDALAGAMLATTEDLAAGKEAFLAKQAATFAGR